jgi:hypothetical protein
MNKNNILTIFVVLVIAFVAYAILFIAPDRLPIADASISSFEECVAAGYPALESYPEQCVTKDGKHFVRMLPAAELEEVSTEVTLRGNFVCLRHWDTSGAVTLECAFGLLDEGGNYYALRTVDPALGHLGNFATDQLVEVVGLFIPGSHERYQTIGTIEVSEVREL